jgi:serine/threonine protein kinase
MKKSNIHESKLVSSLVLEKSIMRKWNSNFIVKSHCAFRDENYYYLAMEWARGGDILSFIRPNTQRRKIFCELGEDAIRFILGCVILGLEELHEK